MLLIGRKGKPVYLSVGASYLSEVDEALRVLKKAGCKDIVLLHCVLSYPTLPDDTNLNVIQTLKTIYPNVRTGFSEDDSVLGERMHKIVLVVRLELS